MHSLTMNTTPYSKARRLFTRTQEEIKLCEDKNCLIFRLMNRRGELKDLLPILEYAFLEDDNKFTVISAKELSLGEKSRSVQVRIYEKGFIGRSEWMWPHCIKSKKKWNSSVGSTLSPLRLRMDDFPVVLADAAERMLKTTMDLSLLLQHLKQIDQVKYDPDFWEDITEGMCY
ncbi:hypothetical protein Tco_0000383 [Tanacetum coccineum]